MFFLSLLGQFAYLISWHRAWHKSKHTWDHMAFYRSCHSLPCFQNDVDLTAKSAQNLKVFNEKHKTRILYMPSLCMQTTAGNVSPSCFFHVLPKFIPISVRKCAHVASCNEACRQLLWSPHWYLGPWWRSWSAKRHLNKPWFYRFVQFVQSWNPKSCYIKESIGKRWELSGGQHGVNMNVKPFSKWMVGHQLDRPGRPRLGTWAKSDWTFLSDAFRHVSPLPRSSLWLLCSTGCFTGWCLVHSLQGNHFWWF